MKPVTTALITKFDEPQAILNGTEQWPIIGDALTPEQAQSIQSKLSGLTRHWDCNNKAEIVLKELGVGAIVAGSLLVLSSNPYSEYGFYYNPPLEFHMWVLSKCNIIDFALPGVIEKGLNTRDHIGPMITGRKPAILAGKPPIWLKYRREAVIKIIS